MNLIYICVVLFLRIVFIGTGGYGQVAVHHKDALSFPLSNMCNFYSKTWAVSVRSLHIHVVHNVRITGVYLK